MEAPSPKTTNSLMRWLPLALGLAAATASLFLWSALKADEEARIHWLVDRAASDLKGRLEALQQGEDRLTPLLQLGTLSKELFPGEAPRDYTFTLFLGPREIYSSPAAAAADFVGASSFERDADLNFPDGAWRLRVRPSAEFLAVQRSLLPDAALAAGLLLSVLLAWSVWLTRLARSQAREIAHQRVLADTESQAKSRFLANISREPRNPLNMIMGYSQILLSKADGPLNAEQEEDLRRILLGGRALTSILDEVLELARLEAGKVRLQRKTLPTSTVMESLRAEFEPKALGRGLKFDVDLGPYSTLAADPERLRLALARLVDNALKFTTEGGISLAVKEKGGEVVFSVQDTGPGFSAEEKRRLFEPFWQSKHLNGFKKTEGLGLGLHLARRIVELHGGSIEAVGKPGSGSTFSIRLPTSARSNDAGEETP